jgi:hypothetical protein
MAHRITFKEIRTVLSLMAPPRIRTSGRRLPRGPFRDAAVAWYAAYETFTERGRRDDVLDPARRRDSQASLGTAEEVPAGVVKWRGLLEEG